ncbi:MAG TPA: PEGA domain-containing protein, partial [Polyangiaceae bacterium]|nr:PEGA domain-containing protein [Polyangiaceae bacterium]
MRIAAPLATLSFVAMLVTATVGLAQSADAQAEASRHFWVGLELVRESAWDAALAEFLRSRELFATANALENAAVCLRELGRFDEALDLYDELIARFSTSLPAAERALVDADVKRLTPYVGSVSIDSRPPGAALFFDGRARGTTPARTLRALVGTRSVRVVHEAYAPFEGKVRVTSGETSALSADLVAASLVGHVQVAERSGGVYEVLIDGVVVGVTPWEGTLTQGTHTVALRSEAERGTEPRAIEVDLAHPLDLVLDARPLLGQLRVEPTPADARIRVDGKDVGRGSWSGYLQPGEHGVSASADWHETTTMTVRTSSRSPRVLRPTLRTVPRMSAELWAGPTPYSDLGARNAPNCNAGCVGSVVGLAGGYALTQRLSLQLFT